MLYTKEQTDALKGAIRKWEGIVHHGKVDHGTRDCACCLKWWTPTSPDCIGCPVRQSTGKKGCICTPYIIWFEHHFFTHNSRHKKVMCKICSGLAVLELEFLRELLNRSILLRRLT